MKKLLTLALVGGIFAATSLQAQVNIYISGSTAFRANAWRAITNLYGGGLTGQNPGGTVNLATNNSGASLCTLTGTMAALGGQTVNVFMSWNGSAQGTHNVVNNDSISFLTNSFTGTTNDNVQITHTVDLAFSDVFQSTTPYNSTTLVDTNVAVIPFVWVRSKNAPTSVQNITIQQIAECWGAGQMELSLFTGNNADDTTTLYFTGRNKDSGTRLAAASDFIVSGSPSLYWVTNGNWAPMTANFIANGVNYGPGFNSGSTEAGTANGLSAVGANGYGLGPIGYPDARTVVGNGGQIINYNGALPFTGWSAAVSTNGTTANALPTYPDFTPIIKGQYSFWSYEHLFMRPGLSGNIPTFYQALVSGVDSDLASVEANNSTSLPVLAVRISEMKVSRSADGGPIHP
jgi:hypothetical protein